MIYLTDSVLYDGLPRFSFQESATVNSNLRELQSALQSRDEETRHSAIQSLRGTAVQDVCTLLFFAMGDDSWRVRKEAVDVFATSRPDEEMVVALLELLRCADNAGLRNSAVETLVKLGNCSLTPLVSLVNDADVDVRKFVIDVMGTIASPDMYIHLVAALDDQDVNVAAAAAEHLGNLGDSRAVPHLIRSIIDNSHIFFRFSALAAIGKLAVPSPVPDEIMQLANNDVLQKPLYACLGSIADESSVSVLIDGMASRQISSRKAAVAALYKIYARSNTDSRTIIENALSLMNGGKTIPLLIELIDDDCDPDLEDTPVGTHGSALDLRIIDLLHKAIGDERLTAAADRVRERSEQLDLMKDLA